MVLALLQGKSEVLTNLETGAHLPGAKHAPTRKGMRSNCVPFAPRLKGTRSSRGESGTTQSPARVAGKLARLHPEHRALETGRCAGNPESGAQPAGVALSRGGGRGAAHGRASPNTPADEPHNGGGSRGRFSRNGAVGARPSGRRNVRPPSRPAFAPVSATTPSAWFG